MPEAEVTGMFFQIIQRLRLRLRNLHLEVVAHTGDGIGPVVRDGEAARRGGRDERARHVADLHAEQAGALAIHVHVHGGEVERLGKMHIAQRGNLLQLRVNFVGEFLVHREARAGDGDFDGRRRTEAHHAADDIARLE